MGASLVIERGLQSAGQQLRDSGSVIVVYGLSSSVARGISSWTRDRTCVPCIGGWIRKHWTTKEVPHIVFDKI